jgi:hypothetical protein
MVTFARSTEKEVEFFVAFPAGISGFYMGRGTAEKREATNFSHGGLQDSVGRAG